MGVKEFFGKDIMKAYDGDYLSDDFGYSCANFNIEPLFFGFKDENNTNTFDLYTKNTKNISCIVYFDENDKISGRRLFFKGKSMINDKEFDIRVKMGSNIKYMYGYYGSKVEEPQYEIYQYIIRKYGHGLIYSNRGVIENGRINRDIPNFWIMGINNVDFNEYPPVDLLYVSTSLKALSNFDPSEDVIDVLKKDFRKSNITFEQAYRFQKNKRKWYNQKTWDDHKGIVTDIEDFTKLIEEEEE